MNDQWGMVFAAAVLAFVILWFYWYVERANRLLAEWAAKNHFIILNKQHRFLRRGPYLLRASDDQAVFRVEVQDPRGIVRTAWIRIGSFWTGLFNKKVSVRWDD